MVRWAFLDKQPLSWDQAVHTENAWHYKHALKNGDWGDLLHPTYFSYPPLYHYSLALVLPFVHDANDAGALINVVYLAGLIIAVYLIGARLLSRAHGLMAAAFVSAIPVLSDHLRTAWVDPALTMWSAWTFYAWLASDHFQDKTWSRWWVVIFSAGMLTKWTLFIYLLGPLALSGIHAIRSGTKVRYIKVMGTALLLISPWYIINLLPTIRMILSASAHASATGKTYGWLGDYFWYVFAIPESLNIVMFTIFILGLSFAVWKKKFIPVILWLVIPLFALTPMTNRNIRYEMPILPAVAVLSVAFLPFLPPRRVWKMALYTVTAILIIGFAALFHLSPRISINRHWNSVLFPVLETWPPQTCDWKMREVFQCVSQLQGSDTHRSRAIVTTNHDYYHGLAVNYYARQAGLVNINFAGPSRKRWLDFVDFLVIKRGGNISGADEFFSNTPQWFPRVFKLAGSWIGPDQQLIQVFHADPDPWHCDPVPALTMKIPILDLPRIHVDEINMRVIPASKVASLKGIFQSLDLTARSITYNGFRLDNATFRFIRPQINLPYFFEQKELCLIRADRLSVSGTIHSDSIESLVVRKLPQIKDFSVEFDGGDVKVRGRYGIFPFSGTYNLRISDEHLHGKLTRLALGPVRLPAFLLNLLCHFSYSLTPHKEMPFCLDVSSLNGEGDRLEIRSTEKSSNLIS